MITLSNDHCEGYLDAVEHHGCDAAESRIYASQWTIVADNPERVWTQANTLSIRSTPATGESNPAIAG